MTPSTAGPARSTVSVLVLDNEPPIAKVVSNARVVESSRSEAGYAALDGVYVSRGYITQCGHCRRVQNPMEAARWDWVPAYVSRPRENVSHSLCPTCVEVYYPTES